MKNEKFTSIWDALEDTPEAAENMKVRSGLMMALKGYIERAGWTQAQAATHFHVTQPRISDLLRGKISVFSVDSLINMTAQAGMRVELHIRDAA
ncbi:MAG: XRE family transcriptional regulator [Pseudomonadota bacterium]|nr:XRE family transcriptional regulator [Pseudomonadota bacterium]